METGQITKSKREFSRKHMSEERAAVAKEIHKVRREYFKGQKALKEQLDSVLEAAKSKQATSAQVKDKIESAEQQLNDRSNNVIKRLLFYRSINKIRNEVKSYKVTEENLTQEMASLKSTSREIESLTRDRAMLGEAKQKLDKFYGHVDETWNKYKDDLASGNVKTFLNQRDTVLVHAFQNPVFSPSDENGVIRKEIRWRDKLDLLMALEPCISASAVNEKLKDTFAPVGVVVGSGQIVAASSQDLGSRAVDKNSRYIGRNMRSERVRDQIDGALKEEKSGWTEFVINQPKIAGIFFKVESNGKMADLEIGSDTNIKEVVAIAQERNLPLFALKEGKLYHIKPEEALNLGNPIESIREERIGLTRYKHQEIRYPNFEENQNNLCPSKDLANLPHDTSSVYREAIIEKFMSDSPFQLRHFPEALQIESRAEGRSRYLLLTASTKGKSLQEETIPAGAANNVEPMNVKIVSTIPGPTSLNHIVQLDDGEIAIWQESRNSVGARSRFRAGSTYSQDRLIGKERSEGRLYIGGYFVESKVTTASKLVMALNKELSKVSNELRKNPDSAVYKNYSSRLAFFAYGVAEEARKAGDERTASFAEAAASKILPIEQYQETIKRRVSENGTFKLSREELLGDSKS